MHIRLRTILSITVILAMVAVAALTVTIEQPVYAKGSVKSSGGGDSGSSSNSDSNSSAKKSDSGSSSRSSSNSSSNSNSNSSSSSSSHSANAPSSSQNSNSSNSNRSSVSSGSSSSRSDLDSRYNVRGYQSPSSSPRSSLDQQFSLRTPGSRYDDKRPTPTYRKDYADIGDIWKNRQESRSRSSDRNWDTRRNDDRRPSLYYDRPYDRNWSSHSYQSPFRYRYYSYDYRPRDCYPSLYCYYYDYCPPYISHDRVVFSARFSGARVYVEIPVFLYQRSDDYYLRDRGDKELWANLRDIQRGWELSNPELVMDHVKQNSTIEVFLKGEYTYSVDWLDYYDMTRDAMSVIQTRTFDFDRVTRRDGNLYVAHGRHTYADESGLLKTVYITYTFERNGGEWYIVAVGSSTMPI